MPTINLTEETKLSMSSCLEGYITEIVDSLRFSHPELSDVEANAVVKAVHELVESASDNISLTYRDYANG